MTLDPRPRARRLPGRRTLRRAVGAFAIAAVGTAAFWVGGRTLAGSVETATTASSSTVPSASAAPTDPTAPSTPTVAPAGMTSDDWMAAHPDEIAEARAKVDAARTAAAAVAAAPTVPSTLYDTAGDAGQALRDLAWAVPASVTHGVETKQRWFDCSGEYFGLALAAVDLNREPTDAAVTAYRTAYEDAQSCLVGVP